MLCRRTPLLCAVAPLDSAVVAARRSAARCSSPSVATAAPSLSAEPRTINLRSAEARLSLRFAAAEGDSGAPSQQYVVVSAVAVGSEAEAAGIRPGDRVVAMSDPIRPGEMWQVGGATSPSAGATRRGASGASLRFCRDALRLRALPDFTIVVASPPESWWDGRAPVVLDEGKSIASPGSPLSTPSAATDSCALPTASQRRTAKREAYLEVVGKRDDTRFFSLLFAGVLAVPLCVLFVASRFGWLDPLAR